MAPLSDSMVKFDAFADEHERLEHTLSELRDLLAQRKDGRAAIATLGILADHLKSHFDHEEQEDGLFENVVDQAPRLESRAAALIQEHVAMSEALTDMQLSALHDAPSESWWRDLNTHFEAFWKLFCRHERAEIDLVQEAFHDDIGAAD